MHPAPPPPQSLRLAAEADFPTLWAHFRILGFEWRQLGDALSASGRSVPGIEARTPSDHRERPKQKVASHQASESAVVLKLGDVAAAPALLRIHSQCLTGDVFGSLRCDCRQQLELALAAIAAAGAGLLIYEDKEGRGIGLMNKLRAYALQDEGADTVEANQRLGFAPDQRDYRLPAAILNHLGARQVRLLSNNPDKVAALERAGIAVVELVPCAPDALSPHAQRYLEVKREKLGHLRG
ncbi:MAG TPA: GTP cyclohydrolase II [Terriglobales bacterium]|nr:GTP cyclohydrolase II [Terriglobales bacterium]